MLLLKHSYRQVSYITLSYLSREFLGLRKRTCVAEEECHSSGKKPNVSEEIVLF
jgi:hypothetical protein